MIRTLVLCFVVTLMMTSQVSSQQCSSEDRKVVMKEWENIVGIMRDSSNLRIYMIRDIIVRLVEKHPDAAEVFKNVDFANPNSVTFRVHCMRMFGGLDMILNLMGDPEALDSALEHLAEQHAARPGVRAAHFLTFAALVHENNLTCMADYDTMSWEACVTPVIKKLVSKLPE